MRAPWMHQNSKLVTSTRIGDRREMAMRRRLAVVALAALCCCCLIHHASSAAADASFPPGLKVKQDYTRAAPPSCGTDDQAAVMAGEAEAAGDGGGGGGRMDLQLEDYPGSGANDRHSPWGMERRN